MGSGARTCWGRLGPCVDEPQVGPTQRAKAVPGGVSSLAFQDASPAGTGRVLWCEGLAVGTSHVSILEDAGVIWVGLLPCLLHHTALPRPSHPQETAASLKCTFWGEGTKLPHTSMPV